MRKLLFITVLALTSCKTIWKAPTVENVENNAPRVVSVAFSDTATVVEMEKEVGYGFLIGGNAMLVTEAMQSAALRWTDGVPKVDGLHSTAKARFRLGFDAVGKHVKRLDFTEGAGAKDYRIWGIKPKGKELAEYQYNPIRTAIDGEGTALLKEVLKPHEGKVIILQFVDMESDESISVLRQSKEVRRTYAEEPRVAFVFLSRPDGKDYGEGTQSAILVGRAAFMEFVSPEEYERLISLLKPYISSDRVLCLDQSLNVLTPGLYYQSPKHFEIQLESLTKSRNLQ